MVCLSVCVFLHLVTLDDDQIKRCFEKVADKWRTTSAVVFQSIWWNISIKFKYNLIPLSFLKKKTCSQFQLVVSRSFSWNSLAFFSFLIAWCIVLNSGASVYLLLDFSFLCPLRSRTLLLMQHQHQQCLLSHSTHCRRVHDHQLKYYDFLNLFDREKEGIATAIVALSFTVMFHCCSLLNGTLAQTDYAAADYLRVSQSLESQSMRDLNTLGADLPQAWTPLNRLFIGWTQAAAVHTHGQGKRDCSLTVLHSWVLLHHSISAIRHWRRGR